MYEWKVEEQVETISLRNSLRTRLHGEGVKGKVIR